MKLIILLFLLLPLNVFAQSGNSWDPIYLKIQPTQQTKNQETTSQLKSQYGINEFYICYPCSGKDTSNPYTETNCLIQTQYCLESRQMIKIKGCPEGESNLGGFCVKLNSGDISQETINEALKLMDKGSLSATCQEKVGYVWDNGSCISKDSGCKVKYGQFSYYTGEKYVCGCVSGYEWQNNSCVLKIDKSLLIVQPGENLQDKLIRLTKSIDSFLGNVPSRPPTVCEEFNAILTADGSCKCASGYGYSDSRGLCVKKSADKSVNATNQAEVNNSGKVEKINQESNKLENQIKQITTTENKELSDDSASKESNKIPNRLTYYVVKPIKSFFGHFFSKLAHWFLNN